MMDPGCICWGWSLAVPVTRLTASQLPDTGQPIGPASLPHPTTSPAKVSRAWLRTAEPPGYPQVSVLCRGAWVSRAGAQDMFHTARHPNRTVLQSRPPHPLAAQPGERLSQGHPGNQRAKIGNPRQDVGVEFPEHGPHLATLLTPLGTSPSHVGQQGR